MNLKTPFQILHLVCIVAFFQKTNCTHLNLKTFAYESCPHTSFCEIGHKPLPGGLYPCCEACSCSEDCHVNSTCCPDSNFTNGFTRGNCKLQSEYFDLHREKVFLDTGYGSSYYVVDTCEVDHDEDAITGCLKPRTLEEHMFVSDPNTSIIYKNGKCAECNGVQTYDTWNLVILCKYDDALMSVDKRNDYLLDKCSLVSQPPDTLRESTKHLICSPETIDSCNVTGEWDLYDKELEHACETLNMEYRDEYIVNGKVRYLRTFRNIYCYLCNKNADTIATQCLTKLDPSRDEKVSGLGLAPLTAVFDSRKTKTGENRRCRMSEIEEPIGGSCVQLLCPFGKTTMYGECIDDVEYIYVSLASFFKVEFIDPAHKNENGYVNVTDEMADAFLEEIKRRVNAASCRFCSARLVSDTYLFITSVQTEQCPLSKLLKVYEYFSKMSVMSFSIYNRQYDVSIRQIGRQPESLFAGDYRVLDGERCTEGAVLTTKFYCQRLVFSVDDLTAHGVPITTIDKLLDHSDLHDDAGDTQYYVICLKDYLVFKNTAPIYPRKLWVLVVIGVIANTYIKA